MKKIISLILLMLFLTGCEATYNVEITGDNFKENLSIYTDSSKKNQQSSEGLTYKELFDYQKDNFRPALYNDSNYDPYATEKQPEVEYYTEEIIDNESQYGINYKYTFKISDYIYSSAVNTCYKELNIKKSNSIYTIKTSKLASCFENNTLDKLTVNLKLNYKVLDHNADSVNNNTYTWIITKDNYQDKSINIMYNKDNTNLEYQEKESNPNENPTPKPDENPEPTPKKNNILTYIFVGSAVFIFLIGIIGFIKYQSIQK